MRVGFLVAAAIAGLVVTWIFVATRPMETVLPNGFVIRGNSTVLSADRRTVLRDNVEFMCFDDRFLFVTLLSAGKGALFDNQTGGQVDHDGHPALHAPGRLLYGPKSCNGYHAEMNGPGLLHDDGKWPFLPSCRGLNRDDPRLKDRAWLDRPCAD